jgi:hypothetical protein
MAPLATGLLLANTRTVHHNTRAFRTVKEFLMLKARVVAITVCAGLTLVPGKVHAQSSTLATLMSRVFVDQVVLTKTPAGVGVVAHDPIFANDPTVTTVTTLIQQVSQQIGSQVSTFPLGSSSGGFTYRFDPALGTFSRSTDSFGPAFAERAATVGKQKLSVGMNYQHGKYTTLDGKDLPNGEIKFYLLHQPLNPRSYVEGDVIEAALRMNLTSDTTVFFANYGVTDTLDVGLAIPIERVKMDLTYHATILDFATKVSDPTRHLFANGSKTQDFTSSGSASGIGDVVLRAKYAFLKKDAGALAAGLDIHLPSGDDQNMLGTGATQTQFFLIASAPRGNLAPHVNVGYTVASKTASNQVNYVGGTEYAVAPKVTIVGDLVGRTLQSTLRLKDISVPHTFQQGSLTAPVETTTLQEVTTESRTLTTVLATGGIKFNPWQNLLISAHVLVPLNDAGLRSKVTPVVGFDYSF